MLRLVALISCMFLSSIAFTSNILNEDLSGDWMLEFAEKEAKPVTLSIARSSLLRMSEKFNNADFYTVIATDPMSGFFGMSILENYENNNHIVWYQPNVDKNDNYGGKHGIDTESNIIIEFKKNEIRLGTDTDSNKDFAVMRKL